MIRQPMTLTLEMFRRDGIGEFCKLTTAPVETVEEALEYAREKARAVGMSEGADYRVWSVR